MPRLRLNVALARAKLALDILFALFKLAREAPEGLGKVEHLRAAEKEYPKNQEQDQYFGESYAKHIYSIAGSPAESKRPCVENDRGLFVLL